jgi:hypothetical protein
MRTIILYLGEFDFESASASEDWLPLLDEFDSVILMIYLETVPTAQFLEEIDDELYTVRLFESSLGMAAAFIDEVDHVLENPEQSYLQIVSHGLRQGVAIRRANRKGIAETLVQYNQLTQIFHNQDSRLPLNLMTVCESSKNNLIDLPLRFLATAVGESVENESITDSLNLIRVVNAHDYSAEHLIQVVANTNNEYHLYVDGHCIFPLQ